MSTLPQFRAGEPTPTRYGLCVLLGLIGVYVAGATIQAGATTPIGLFAIGTGVTSGAVWLALAYLEAGDLDESEVSR
jgi:hypothetical protein